MIPDYEEEDLFNLDDWDASDLEFSLEEPDSLMPRDVPGMSLPWETTYVDEPDYPVNIMLELNPAAAGQAGRQQIQLFRNNLAELIQEGLFPTRRWLVFRLRYVNHLQPEVIAQKTGCSPNTVRKEIAHIRRILKKHILRLFQGKAVSKVVVTLPPVSRTGVDIPVDDMDFSIRTYNCLKRAGIHSLSDIEEAGLEGLMHVRNLGRKSLKEITDTLFRCYCIRL